MRKLSILLLIVSTCCMSALAFGEPRVSGVSGTFQEGEVITITGSGFGTKTNTSPLLWDDFEEGRDGISVTSLTTRAWTQFVAPGNSITYSAENNLPGSMLCSKHTMQKRDGSNLAELMWLADKPTEKLFISFWVYFQWADLVCPECGDGYPYPSRHQIKLWRVRNFPNNDALALKDQHWSSGDGMGEGHYYQLDVPAPYKGFYYPEARPQDGAWYRVEFQVQQSTPGVSNGSIEIWHSQQSGPIAKVADERAIMTRTVSDLWNQIQLGQCPTNNYATLVTYYDDVYLDNAWSRVVVGDSGTYDACTRREIQIPSAWSDNSITIAVNTASFPYGAAYLYVVDGQGARNSVGYPITIQQSPKWLANVISRWQAGSLIRNDVNRAVYWYLKGKAPVGDPMSELTEEDIGNAIKLSLTK
jgi:hypothetical protein